MYLPWRHEIRLLWTPAGVKLSHTPRRKPGTDDDVAAFRAALDALEHQSALDAQAGEAAADRLELSGAARDDFLCRLDESPAWLDANDAVAKAAQRISKRQEARARAETAERSDELFWGLAVAALTTLYACDRLWPAAPLAARVLLDQLFPGLL